MPTIFGASDFPPPRLPSAFNNSPVEGVRHGERGHDPAVGVDDVGADVAIVDAVDGVTDELGGRQNQDEQGQKSRGELIMQTENGTVVRHIPDLTEVLERSKHS